MYHHVQIFNLIKKVKFHEEVSPLLSLLEKHLDRVVYVKDHYNLPNVLFIGEKDFSRHESLCFAHFSNNGTDDAFLNEMDDIYKETEAFLEQSEGYLYLHVGFIQSELRQEDSFRAHKLLKDKVVADKYKALAMVKRFPEWYIAKFPSDILEEHQYLEILQQLESDMLQDAKKRLLDEIDASVATNDEKLFRRLSEEFKKVCGN